MEIKGLTIILILALLGLSSCKQDNSINNWDKFFKENNVNGTIVLKNTRTCKTLIYNKERSNKEFVPASTFKILNSMIALQESSIASINDTIKWDGINRNFKSWNKDQTMKSAFPISCVWFYQELARRTGQDKMQDWIDKTNYGNKKIENKIDRFWLDGNLAISANEQIDFLEKLVTNGLPFDNNIQETVKEIMITDSTKNYIIHSKTGWSQDIGWNVGYIETKDNVWIFALNIDMEDLSKGKLRKILTYDILKEQKIVE
jgi:beta-lactamase class D